MAAFDGGSCGWSARSEGRAVYYIVCDGGTGGIGEGMQDINSPIVRVLFAVFAIALFALFAWVVRSRSVWVAVAYGAVAFALIGANLRGNLEIATDTGPAPRAVSVAVLAVWPLFGVANCANVALGRSVFRFRRTAV